MKVAHSPWGRTIGSLLVAATVAVLLPGCDRTSNMTDLELLDHARALRAKGNDQAAIVEIRNALQKNAKNAEARVMLAEIFVDAGGGKQAQNELEIALQRGAQPARVKLPMARAYLLQGSYDAAAREATVTLSTLGADRAALMEVEGRARIAMRQYARGCALFDESRTSDPQFMDAYWGSATCAAVNGDSDKARSIIDEAIRIKPDVSQSWVLMGDINRVDHKLALAEQQYTKAIALKKNNVDALLGRALAYVEERKLDATEADLAEVDRIYKGHPLGSYINGIVRFRQGRFAEAKSAFETTLTTAPTHFQSILWLGLTNFEQRNYELAATELNQFLTLQPNAVKVKAILALARARLGGVKQANVDLGELGKLDIDDPQTLAMIGETHTFLGNPAIGSQFLAKAVDRSPDALQTRVNLATSLLEKNDIAGAIGQLETVLGKQADYVPAETLLIRALMQNKDYPAALDRARALQAQDPKSPAAQDYIGSIQLRMGDEAAARSTFEKLLASDPKFFPAANNLALLAIKNGDLPAAQAYYRGALNADPASLAAMLGLHNVERSLGRASEAEQLLVQATKAYPTEVLPSQMLAQTYLAARMPRKALDVTEESMRAHPGDAGLLESRGLAYLAVNEPASAIIAFNKLVQVRGDSANAYVYVAQAQNTLGDRAGARQAVATALKLEPTNVRARMAQGVSLIADGKAAEAVAVAKALQRDVPDDPEPYVLEASALAAGGRAREGVKLLAAATQRFPKNTKAHVALARLQSAAGDLPAMVAGVADWHRTDPQSPFAAEALGEAYLRTGDEAAALTAYQDQLVLQPNDVRAMNNVAFLMRKQAPQQAAELAGRALQIDPGNADVLDTLGQIQAERGDLDGAVKSFGRANQLAPKNAATRYHLAVTLARNGQGLQARRELERLLAATPSFDEAADARALLSQLPKS